nr:uncharacterized protein LOC129387294 isoform X1 [Dermacentor andersoni]
MSFLVLACSVGLAAGSFDYAGRPTLEDLKQFYEVDKDIYVLQRSFSLVGRDNQEAKCIYNEGISLQENTLILKEAYLRGLTIYYYKVEMNVTDGQGRDQAPLMKAKPEADLKISRTVGKIQEDSTDKQPTDSRQYVFQYHDLDKHCAVVTFNDGVTRCELLFWGQNNRITQRFENCQQEYKSLCPHGKAFTVYDSQCTDWFRPKFIQLPWSAK